MKYDLKIISPRKVLLEKKVDFVVVPGIVGELGILPRHTNFLTILKKGMIRAKIDSQEEKLEIEKGFLEVNEKGVLILVKTS